MLFIRPKGLFLIMVFCLIQALFLIVVSGEVLACVPGETSSCYSLGSCCSANPGGSCDCCISGCCCTSCCPTQCSLSGQLVCDSSGNWVEECCGSCFPGETRIEARSEEGEGGSETKKIEDLEPGDVVSSFNPETGEISESVVEDISQRTSEGYYILETESGKKVKVTAEHPFLAVKAKNNQSPSTKFQTTFEKVGDIFSQTLTYRLLTGLQAKITEILD